MRWRVSARSWTSLRAAIWGWSGGGSNTLNAMFRKPDVYHVGIAVVPKPQPQYYNAGYLIEHLPPGPR